MMHDDDDTLTFCMLFAADNSIKYSSEKKDVIVRYTNRDQVELDKWSKKCLLNVNPKKTKTVCFSTKKIFRMTVPEISELSNRISLITNTWKLSFSENSD